MSKRSTTPAGTRLGPEGLLEQHNEAMTATEMYFVAVLNAIILAAGGQLVISRTYLDGQPLREVMVENRPARISQDGTISEARLVLSLGRTDSEVAEGSGGASAMLWVPPQ